MARLFDDAALDRLEADVAAVTAFGFTVSGWFNANDLGVTGTVFYLGDKDSANFHCHLKVAGAEAGDFLKASVRNTTSVDAVSSIAVTVNTLQHALCTITSTDITVYLDGGNSGTNTHALSPPTPDRTSIGRRGRSTPDSYFSGRLQEVGLWNVVLNAGEIAALSKGYSPALVRLTALKGYWPIMGQNSPEIDLSNGGVNLTVTGTAQSAHRTMYRPTSAPSLKWTTAVAAAAGGKHLTLLGVGR